MKNSKLIKIVNNFITEDEIKILNDWTLFNYKEPYFIDPQMNDDETQTRYTTRHAYFRSKEYVNYKIKYPKECFDIQKRIFEYLELKKEDTIPFPMFTDGIVTTLGFPPGGCRKHKDPIYRENTYTLHCNFCTQNPESGGITILEGKKYPFNQKDMIMYVPSHLEHEVEDCFGNIPRILWVFGFSINFHQLNKIFRISNIEYR